MGLGRLTSQAVTPHLSEYPSLLRGREHQNRDDIHDARTVSIVRMRLPWVVWPLIQWRSLSKSDLPSMCGERLEAVLSPPRQRHLLPQRGFEDCILRALGKHNLPEAQPRTPSRDSTSESFQELFKSSSPARDPPRHLHVRPPGSGGGCGLWSPTSQSCCWAVTAAISLAIKPAEMEEVVFNKKEAVSGFSLHGKFRSQPAPLPRSQLFFL